MPPDDRGQAPDPFTQFWSDVASRMGLGAQPAPPSTADAMKQMQRVFLDALAKYCDDFMRSPAFLEMMKRQMEGALNFQQQVNQFLTQAQRGATPAAQAESADLVALVRSLRNHVESLERKVEAMSASSRTPHAGGGARAPKRSANRTAPSKKPPKSPKRGKK